MENEPATVDMSKYNQRELCDEMDQLNRELDGMLEKVLNTRVRTSILEAELATMFNPEMIEHVKQTKLSCDKCTKAIKGETTVYPHDQGETTTDGRA